MNRCQKLLLSLLAFQDSDERVYRLGHIPPRTRDAEKYKTADDDINYRALCRGRELLNASERAHLKCHLSDLAHPFHRVVNQDCFFLRLRDLLLQKDISLTE